MGLSFTIKNQHAPHFITCTVHQWVDVFTRAEYVNILLGSIRHCQKHKGLEVHSWVIISNHFHMILSSKKSKLSDIIRDLKKYTSKKNYEAIEKNSAESRKRWMLWLLNLNGTIWFWEEGYHGEEIYSQDFFIVKLNYIHLNPVRAFLVEKEEEYLYSSCGDYYGTRKGLLDLVFL
jgi:REP element-mobilizing transposase RayT